MSSLFIPLSFVLFFIFKPSFPREALKEEAKKIKKELAAQSKRKEERLEEKAGDEVDKEGNDIPFLLLTIYVKILCVDAEF